MSVIFALLFARAVHLNRGLPYSQFTEKKLRLLTYSTFMAAAGPGAEIVKRFKREHGCEVEITTTTDAGLLLERLKIAQVAASVDLVLGLDGLYLHFAEAQTQWHPVPALARDKWNPAVHSEAAGAFVPFDWSPMTFIYKQGKFEPPQVFDDLARPAWRAQIALQDPRVSSPGLQFFYWVKDLMGAGSADFLRRLQPNVQSVSPSWAFSYGLFKKNQARLVFSYVTSLAYHWGFDHDRSFQAVVLPEGHPVQVEYVGIPATCRECELAEAFTRTLLEPWAQQLIMQKNFMFPVLKGVEAGTIFSELPALKTRALVIPTSRDLSEWDQVFPR